jgi:hypothetical protein
VWFDRNEARPITGCGSRDRLELEPDTTHAGKETRS